MESFYWLLLQPFLGLWSAWQYGDHAYLKSIGVSRSCRQYCASSSRRSCYKSIDHDILSSICGNGWGWSDDCLDSLFTGFQREDQKLISKLALIPGINEPLVYGLPIVMNPIFAIPFILSQLMATVVAYIATVTQIIPAASVEVPFGLPLFVNAFVGYQSFAAIWFK